MNNALRNVRRGAAKAFIYLCIQLASVAVFFHREMSLVIIDSNLPRYLMIIYLLSQFVIWYKLWEWCIRDCKKKFDGIEILSGVKNE